MKRRNPPLSHGTKVALTSAAGRSLASQRWLTRQLNDPYVRAARAAGFRSRSAYKLLEMNERFHLIRNRARVVDLGAAPGGWMQVALAAGARTVIGVDPLPLAPLAGGIILTGDARDPEMPSRIRQALGGPADLVLSDMAPATTGHATTDHARSMELAEIAIAISLSVLAPGGALVTKLFQGGTEATLQASLRQRFATVRYAKPAASRAASREVYLVALNFHPSGQGRGAEDGALFQTMVRGD